MKLSYRRYDETAQAGAKLLLLHGLFASKENFHSLARRLSKDYSVFVPDLRNHGESPHSDEISYPLMAADVAEFIEEEIGEPAVVLGHSMGGKTAMELALSRPASVAALIVEDISPRRYVASLQNELAALRDLPVERLSSRREAEEWMADRIENRAVALFLLKNLYSAGKGGFSLRLNIGAIESAYEELLDFMPAGRSYRGPSLFIRGGSSPFIRAEDESIIRDHFPRAILKTLPETSHWVHAERPTEVQELLSGFLSAQ